MSLLDIGNYTRRQASSGLVGLAGDEQLRIQTGKELRESGRAELMNILTKGAGGLAGYAAGRGGEKPPKDTQDYKLGLSSQVDSGSVDLSGRQRVNLGASNQVNMSSNSGMFSSFFTKWGS